MSEEIVYKYELRAQTRFKKHLKLIAKRNRDYANKVMATVELLARGEMLPERCHDHALTGNWAGHRECHVLPDLLLIYRILENILILELVDTGTHSDLFKN